jgi:peptide/nickel transport system substrate-binding protein
LERNGANTRNGQRKPLAGSGRGSKIATVMLALMLAAACAPTTTTPAVTTTPPSTPAASPPATSQAAPASVLRIGVLGAAESLDPRVSSNPADTQVMFAIMEPLLTLTPTYQLRPRLATSWTVADDGRSIRLELRGDVRFHDGRPFTSADVKFTLEAGDDGDGYGPVDYLSSVLDGVETPDATTAILRFDQPAAFALYDLALIPMMPADAPADFGAHPIGTGPYMLDGRPSAGLLATRRFDGYWGGEPTLDGVEFHVFGPAEHAGLLDALVRGRVDVAQVGWQADAVRQLERRQDLAVAQIPGTLSQYAILNTRAAPLDDPRVRSAIDHLVPRDRILREAFGGTGFVASTALGGATPWSDAAAPTPFDPERARALLDEAGVDAMRPLTLVSNAGNGTREAIARQLEGALGQHGIAVQSEFVPFPEYLKRASEGDFDVLLSGVAGRGNPVQRVLSAVNAVVTPAPAFGDPRIAELATDIARLDASSGPGADALRELLRLLDEEAAYLYLHVRPETGVRRASVLGWEPHPVAALAYQGLHEVRWGP